MQSAGKFVRAPSVHDSDSDSESAIEQYSESSSAGRYVRISNLISTEFDPIEGVDEYGNLDINDSPIEHTRHEKELMQQIKELKQTVAELSNRSRYEPNVVARAHKDQSSGVEQVASKIQNYCEPTIRWDNIKPFPAGIPATKMWETWTKYIENFEIAASLSNARDPARRVQLLFLSMGEELQGIVRAAKLRPSLDSADCYKQFVQNIDQYFRSMTDTSAEHEAFASMHQAKGESAVSFHARLREKVWLCGYSDTDQERFVRAQLLKGLQNREIAKAARTYGHETNFIVQAATRDEAYARETSADNHNTLSIDRVQSRGAGMHRSRWNTSTQQVGSGSSFGRKRTRNEGSSYGSGSSFEPKRFRNENAFYASRRERCSRCNRPIHKNGPCPAMNKSCNSCGRQGHFAVTCRRKAVSNIRDEQVEPNIVERKVSDQVMDN